MRVKLALLCVMIAVPAIWLLRPDSQTLPENAKSASEHAADHVEQAGDREAETPRGDRADPQDGVAPTRHTGITILRDGSRAAASSDRGSSGGQTLGGVSAGSTTKPHAPKFAWTSAEIKEFSTLWREAGDAKVRTALLAKLLDGMTVENAEEIRAAIIAHLSPDSEAFKEFHRVWGSMAGADAVVKGTETREPDMNVTLAGWAAADPDAAMQWYDNLPAKGGDFSQGHLAMGMAEGLAKADAGLASEFVLGLVASGIAERHAEQMIRVVAREMWNQTGANDSAAVIGWADALPAGSLRGAANAAIAGQYAAADPLAAASWAEGLTESRGSAVAGVARSWARTDGFAAVEWLSGLEQGGSSTYGYYGAFQSWARSDAPAAVDYLSGMPKSGTRDAAVKGYVDFMSYRNPSAAVKWVEQIGDARSRNRSMHETVQRWTKKDAVGAGEYLVGMAPSTGRDYAIRGFTEEIVVSNPDLALQWAGAMQSEGLRQHTIAGIGHRIYRDDPQGMRDWLPSSGLTQEMQQRVLDRLGGK